MNRRICVLTVGFSGFLTPAEHVWAQPCTSFAESVLQESIGYDDPSCIAAGDINGDSITDLVIATRTTDGTIAIQLGMPGGGFSQPIISSSFGQSSDVTNWCELINFNADNILDLVLVRRSFGFQVFSGNGDGTFTLQDSIAGIENGTNAVTGDFNGDGSDDALICGAGGALVVFIDSNGQATPGQQLAPESSYFADVADLDFDGDLDLLIPSGSDQSVLIFSNDGSGVFTQTDMLEVTLRTATSAKAIVVDMEGDLDVAAAAIDGELNIFENLGNEVFARVFSIVIPGAPQDPWHLTSGDFNADGLPDLVYTGAITQNVGILTNRSDSGFIAFSHTQLFQSTGLPNMSLIIDVDLDGDVDVLSPGFGMGESPIAYIENLTSGTACYADVSGDGTIDLFDVVEVFMEWGKTKSHADVNKDLMVNGIDLSIVINNWGEL